MSVNIGTPQTWTSIYSQPWTELRIINIKTQAMSTHLNSFHLNMCMSIKFNEGNLKPLPFYLTKRWVNWRDGTYWQQMISLLGLCTALMQISLALTDWAARDPLSLGSLSCHTNVTQTHADTHSHLHLTDHTPTTHLSVNFNISWQNLIAYFDVKCHFFMSQVRCCIFYFQDLSYLMLVFDTATALHFPIPGLDLSNWSKRHRSPLTPQPPRL